MQNIDVRIGAGVLRGEVLDGMAVFRGVPFAAPPFGPNRFLPPQPVPRWDGVRDAVSSGLGFPQPVMPGSDPDLMAYVGPAGQGDDCLVLDVWTPDPGAGGLPVMVWIHGGGFMTGAGVAPISSGETFARDGVVYVTINYRMSYDGFLYLGPDKANLGMLDQVAALEWVQENIAAFGGDPGNVTVFGQSAGGVSVMHLLTMPRAQGLFRRAISQSGSSMGAEPLESAKELLARGAEILGVAPTAEAIAQVPREQLLHATLMFSIEYLAPALWGRRSFMISPFRPIVDGDVIPEACVPAAASGVGADIPLLAGTTRDECTFAMFPLGMLDSLNEAWADMALDAFEVTWADLEAYRKGTRPEAGPSELIQAAWTDWAFRIPTIRLAETRETAPAKASPTWLYEFAWPSPTFPAIGASHALELAFTIDRVREMHDRVPAEVDLVGPDAPQSLADAMHGAWIRFATDGDPGWAPYELDRRTTMRFDTESGPVDDLAGPVERQLWEGRR
jgi:para-nitrobenzyl esterase